MFFPIALGFGLLLFLASVARGGSFGKDTRVPSPYNTKFWDVYLRPFAEKAGIPLAFVLKWIEIESGGNPCAFGNKDAKGPDGNPKEMGIAQFYNPDDLQLLGATGNELRAYCTPGTQNISRPLTLEELNRQAKLTVDLINRCKTSAMIDLNKAKSTWNDRDLYALVKLQHALPGISRSGLPAVAKRLGRGPTGWSEFVSTIDDVKLDAGTERYRPVFSVIFSNAEKTASVIPLTTS